MLKLEKIFYIVLPLLVVGIPYHYSVFPLCVAVLFLRCLTAERKTVAAFLMIYAGPTVGCIRAAYPSLPLYGAVFSLLGFFLVFEDFKGFFQKNISGILSLLAIFAIFYISLLNGGGNEYGQDKYAGIVSNGISGLVGFCILFTSRTINNEQFTQMLLVTSIIMVEYIVFVFGVQAGGVFDYNWIREAVSVLDNTTGGNVIGYQHIGMNIAFAYGIFMSSKYLGNKKLLYYSVLCFQLALMSGARQAMLATLVILVIRYAVIGKSGKFNIKGIVLVVLLVFVLVNVAVSLDVEMVKNTLESGDTGRDELKQQALIIFENNRLFGSGLGGFTKITGNNYPHNFFLEVLSECGLVGMCFLSLVCFTFILKHKIGIRKMTGNESFFVIIMIALFVRCMVSGNFTVSIQLFSALFALASLSGNKKL